jgi:hypothetical protein
MKGVFMLQFDEKLQAIQTEMDEKVDALQLEMLQDCNKEQRALIAQVTLLMYDLHTARLLLAHYKEELGEKICKLLQLMLDFEKMALAADAIAFLNKR